MTRQAVLASQARYDGAGIEALADRLRSGRLAVIDESAMIASTLNPPPGTGGHALVGAAVVRAFEQGGMVISFAEIARAVGA